MKQVFFIAVIFLSCAISYSQTADCSIYQSGYFQFETKHPGVVIYRHEGYQIEYNLELNEWVVVKMQWNSNCTYSFVYVATNIRALKPFLETSMNVEIINADEYGYDYKAVSSKTGDEFKGRIVFLPWQLQDDQKQKIETRLAKAIR